MGCLHNYTEEVPRTGQKRGQKPFLGMPRSRECPWKISENFVQKPRHRSQSGISRSIGCLKRWNWKKEGKRERILPTHSVSCTRPETKHYSEDDVRRTRRVEKNRREIFSERVSVSCLLLTQSKRETFGKSEKLKICFSCRIVLESRRVRRLL